MCRSSLVRHCCATDCLDSTYTAKTRLVPASEVTSDHVNHKDAASAKSISRRPYTFWTAVHPDVERDLGYRQGYHRTDLAHCARLGSVRRPLTGIEERTVQRMSGKGRFK